jgi:hypothetical protein
VVVRIQELLLKASARIQARQPAMQAFEPFQWNVLHRLRDSTNRKTFSLIVSESFSGRQLILRPHDKDSEFSLVISSQKNGNLNARFVNTSTLQFDAQSSRILTPEAVFGCIGIIAVDNDVFIGLVSGMEDRGDIEDHNIFCITSTQWYSVINNSLDNYYISNSFYGDSGEGNQSENRHPCFDVSKYLAQGTFYFSYSLDLTQTAQERWSNGQNAEHDGQAFSWNTALLRELLNFRNHLFERERSILDGEGMLLRLLQGYIGVEQISFSNQLTYKVAIISRLSSQRAGTRFSTRGLDDDGNTANFVETETLIYTKRHVFGFVQVRGSVPIFWEQPGVQGLTQKIELSRGAESTAPAFRQHMEKLLSAYDEVHIVNLLSQREAESVLGEAYRYHVRSSLPPEFADRIRMLDFDFYAVCGKTNFDRVSVLVDALKPWLDGHQYFLMSYDGESSDVIFKQNGHLRVNCLDCLDRTNIVEKEVAFAMLVNFLQESGDAQNIFLVRDVTFQTLFRNMFSDNGDALSRIYAGTNAIRSSATRKGKQTWAGMLDDAAKSVQRFVVGTFGDSNRQATINLLLGIGTETRLLLRDPVQEGIRAEMRSRIAEFSSRETILVQVGTWNVHGLPPAPENFTPWVAWASSKVQDTPTFFAMAFQEIVELNPTQILATDPGPRLVWEKLLQKTISSACGASYVLVRSVQLVGASLSIFVRKDCVGNVRAVQTASIKTGLSGLAGNKGSIAIRMRYHDTSLCFVTAHFASGQTAVAERNRDYQTASDGLRFPGGYRLEDHDFVVWAGDFNYRIDYDNPTVRRAISDGNLDFLLQQDQLRAQMGQKRVFVGYEEGNIAFDPTYKFNSGTDNYDTSEKMRIPAWCDRILHLKRGNVRLLQYTSERLYTSDHRPVKATLEVDVVKIDQAKRLAMEKNLLQEKLTIVSALEGDVQVGPPPASGSIKATKLVRFEQAAPYRVPTESLEGLPPPSNDESKWWD